MLLMLHWQGFFNWVKYFLDPGNPFVPWMLVINLVALVLHLYIIYWVYKDALRRYHRGAPWAAATALLPFAGWLFYLLYRSSPLVEYDRLELETFDDTEYEWTDYDAYKRNRHQAMFASIKSLWRSEEGSGYSEWIRRSRERELKRKLSPEEAAQRKVERLQTRAQRKDQQRLRKQEALAVRRQRALAKHERQTLAGAHGFTYKMSDRKQRYLQRKMAVVEQLKLVAREDAALEDLIYEMRYQDALDAARDNLAIAQEMRDPQGAVTYEAYIERLQELLARGGQG
jgi:hypothetical protein